MFLNAHANTSIVYNIPIVNVTFLTTIIFDGMPLFCKNKRDFPRFIFAKQPQEALFYANLFLLLFSLPSHKPSATGAQSEAGFRHLQYSSSGVSMSAGWVFLLW